MLIFVSLILSLVSATSVSIMEPIDGETYDGDWLPLRAIVENENEIPDSVHYTLNGGPVTLIPRLNTDWPTYMQNYQNHGYSESPAPHDNTILWKAAVTGTVHEFPSPVVFEGIVYYPQDNGGENLYALDAATGEIIWVYEGTGYTDDAVTVVNGILYTASDSIFCINAYTGERIWASENGNWAGSTPVVSDGKVYCADDLTVYCLNASNGDVIWSQTLSNWMVSCIALSEGMLFVPTYGTGAALYALDAETGSILWQNTDMEEGYWDSSPVIVEGMIYIGSNSGHVLAINSTTGETEWALLVGQWISATPAYHQGQLFFADCSPNGPYYCLDVLDGFVFWSAPYGHHGSSGLADGLAFFGEGNSTQDSASVVALDMETGAEIWNYRTLSANVGFGSSPSITDGVVYYACTDGYLYAFGTGLKYTYKEDYFYADVGSNELIVTSFDDGVAVTADTINFTVSKTGITLEPSTRLSLQVSPNPFYFSASISFDLSEPEWTLVTLYDLSGRIVTTLENSELGSGQYSIIWDGRKQNGEPASAGIYLCRIQSGGISETIGLCLLR